MGLFDKINLLHVFMVILFVIGVLLLITAFTAYSKLGNTCTSGSLRAKLRWAIGLGTTFAVLSIGYSICIYKAGSSCQLGQRADWKIYSMLVTLMGMGIGLVVLTNGIKSDLKEPGCSVDLGSTPDILMTIAILQIVAPILYIVYIIKTGRPQGSKKPDKDEESDLSRKMKSDSKKTATDKRRAKRFDALIAKKSEELSVVQDRIEEAEANGKNPKPADEEKAEMLVNEIARAKQKRKEVGSVSSSSGSSSSSSSGLSSLGIFGGGGFPGIEDDEDT